MDAMDEDQPFELEVVLRDDMPWLAFRRTPRFSPVRCLQAYASNYVSHAKVDRLLFIANNNQGTAFADDALRLALDELSQVHSHDLRSSSDHCTVASAEQGMFCRATTHISIKTLHKGSAETS